LQPSCIAETLGAAVEREQALVQCECIAFVNPGRIFSPGEDAQGVAVPGDDVFGPGHLLFSRSLKNARTRHLGNVLCVFTPVETP
jgi:hypothetical protein